MKHYDKFIEATMKRLAEEGQFWISEDGDEMIVPCLNGKLVALEPDEGKTFIRMQLPEAQKMAQDAREQGLLETARILEEAENGQAEAESVTGDAGVVG